MCIAFTNIFEILYIYPIKLCLQVQVITCEIGKRTLLVSYHSYPLFFCWRNSLQWSRASFTRFLGHTQQRTTVTGSQRPPPDNTQHFTIKISMQPGGFELKISTGERPQTYASDRAAFGVVTVMF